MREWKTSFHYLYTPIFCSKYHWLSTVGYQGAVEPIVTAHRSQAVRTPGSVDRVQRKLEWTYLTLVASPHTTFMQFFTHYWWAHAQNVSVSCFILSAYCFRAGSQFQNMIVFNKREKRLRTLMDWPTITKEMRRENEDGIGRGSRRWRQRNTRKLWN